MKESIYTAVVIAAMQDASPLNKEKCQELADRFNEEFDTDKYSARGFIAKCRTVENVEYENAPKSVTKTGEPVVRKDQIASDIAEMLGVDGLTSLAKAGKQDLIALFDAITELTSKETEETVFEDSGEEVFSD